MSLVPSKKQLEISVLMKRAEDAEEHVRRLHVLLDRARPKLPVGELVYRDICYELRKAQVSGGKWEHTGDGGCVLRLGKCKAFVYAPSTPDGEWVWHTFDMRGTGGENATGRIRSEAMREAFGSLLMQAWADPQRWQVGRPMRVWPRLPPLASALASGGEGET